LKWTLFFGTFAIPGNFSIIGRKSCKYGHAMRDQSMFDLGINPKLRLKTLGQPEVLSWIPSVLICVLRSTDGCGHLLIHDFCFQNVLHTKWKRERERERENKRERNIVRKKERERGEIGERGVEDLDRKGGRGRKKEREREKEITK